MTEADVVYSDVKFVKSRKDNAGESLLHELFICVCVCVS